MCSPVPNKLKVWSSIRKGLCRKKFHCFETKGKKKCNFYGNAICKTVRKAVTPKQKCLWKIIKNGKKTICRSRVCCNGKKMSSCY